MPEEGLGQLEGDFEDDYAEFGGAGVEVENGEDLSEDSAAKQLKAEMEMEIDEKSSGVDVSESDSEDEDEDMSDDWEGWKEVEGNRIYSATLLPE
jgi:hypothetical protein